MGMMERPSWDEYFMQIAADVARRSSCMRRQVGAILVKDKRILATGYNGVPSGIIHCTERGCYREINQIPSGERHELCWGLHAEQNAIIQAALHGVSIAGATLYCTHSPCNLCAKMIVNAGIRKIVFRGDYPDQMARTVLKEAEVEMEQYTGELK